MTEDRKMQTVSKDIGDMHDALLLAMASLLFTVTDYLRIIGKVGDDTSKAVAMKQKHLDAMENAYKLVLIGQREGRLRKALLTMSEEGDLEPPLDIDDMARVIESELERRVAPFFEVEDVPPPKQPKARDETRVEVSEGDREKTKAALERAKDRLRKVRERT